MANRLRHHPIQVFLSYASTPQDQKLCAKLQNHLAPLVNEGAIAIYSQDDVLPGDEAAATLQARLNTAQIILLLVSADYIASHWTDQIASALARHQAGEAQVVPIILRPVDWRSTPFGTFQPLPPQGQAITTWADPDAAFLTVVQGLRGLVGTIRQTNPFPPVEPDPPVPRWLRLRWQWAAWRPFAVKVGLTSALVTFGVLALRVGQVLQPLELWHYDGLLRSRLFSIPPADPRLFIIAITDDDYQRHFNDPNRTGRSVFLPDNYLKQILKKLTQDANHQPRVIGLDVARPNPTADPALANLLRSTENLVTICSLPGANQAGLAPVPEVAESAIRSDRIAFSDLFSDQDNVVRKFGLLAASGGNCPADQAFALQLATAYLNNDNIGVTLPSFEETTTDLVLGEATLKRLGYSSAGYQRALSAISDLPYEILIQYRHTAEGSLLDVADTVSVHEFLSTDIDPQRFNDKIILIGATNQRGARDWQNTPLGSAPGVVIHAHLASYLLDLAEGQRTQIRWLSIGHDSLLIFVASVAGGAIALFSKPSIRLFVGAGGAVLVLIILIPVVAFWWFNLWLPFVPVILGFLATGGILGFKKR